MHAWESASHLHDRQRYAGCNGNHDMLICQVLLNLLQYGGDVLGLDCKEYHFTILGYLQITRKISKLVTHVPTEVTRHLELVQTCM